MINGILVIRKPGGMTSFDVIASLRRKYGQKKFGHTGTLDPQAEGVLVVLAGSACKALPYLSSTDKTYVASIELGKDTSTQDIWGETVAEQPVNPHFDFAAELARFQGPIRQQIPMTSAKKVNGKKLMDYQRQGTEVEPQFKDVEVYDIHPLDEKDLSFEVSCSSGTFVRTICQDLAHHTGNAGCMKSLLRTRVGNFDLSQAEDLDAGSHTIHSLLEALDGYETVDYAPVRDITDGKRIRLDTEADEVLIVHEGKAMAIYVRDNGDVFACRRGLWS